MRIPQEERRLGLHRTASVQLLVIAATLVIGLAMGGVLLTVGSFSRSASDAQGQESGSTVSEPTESGESARFEVTIRRPAGPPRVDIGLKDPHGNAMTVSCSTCHATRTPNLENKVAADLNEFHGSLKVAHGTISCLSCHNPDDYDSLRLADGTPVEYTNVMTLCAQCHGPQMKDYEHGVHGGMNGYWDLSRGPQTKNNCVDCHNPHEPAFPKMNPTFKPRDRFLDSEDH